MGPRSREALAPLQPVLRFAGICDRGLVREENQDSVLHASIPLGELLIVADGIGGYKGGAVASQMVVEGFRTYLASLPPDFPADQAIREASASTNAKIVATANTPDSPYAHMGSTVVLALLQRNATETHAWIGHIGDSRGYRVHAGRLIRLTTDHSAVQALLNRNLITPQDARHHPNASVLTRCLGHQAEVEISIERVALESGDTLLLCSDGLWGYVEELEIQSVAADLNLALQSTARMLLDRALSAGGQDNIGLEMARLLPSLPVETRLGSSRRLRLFGMIALALFALASLAVLFGFFLTRH